MHIAPTFEGTHMQSASLTELGPRGVSVKGSPCSTKSASVHGSLQVISGYGAPVLRPVRKFCRAEPSADSL